MSDEVNINELIVETVYSLSKEKPAVRKLVNRALNYELDIWNRHIRETDIESEYDLMVVKVIKEMSQ